MARSDVLGFCRKAPTDTQSVKTERNPEQDPARREQGSGHQRSIPIWRHSRSLSPSPNRTSDTRTKTNAAVSASTTMSATRSIIRCRLIIRSQSPLPRTIDGTPEVLAVGCAPLGGPWWRPLRWRVAARADPVASRLTTGSEAYEVDLLLDPLVGRAKADSSRSILGSQPRTSRSRVLSELRPRTPCGPST